MDEFAVQPAQYHAHSILALDLVRLPSLVIVFVDVFVLKEACNLIMGRQEFEMLTVL